MKKTVVQNIWINIFFAVFYGLAAFAGHVATENSACLLLDFLGRVMEIEAIICGILVQIVLLYAFYLNPENN